MMRLSPQRRRRLDAAQARVDLVTQADARFFERFPDRRHRVRHASAAEVEQNALVTGVRPQPCPGRAYFTAIKQIAPGARLRLFTESFADADTDMTEAEAREVFDFLQRSHEGAARIEAKLRAAIARRGAA